MNQQQGHNALPKVMAGIGLMCVACGLIANPYFLAQLFSGDGQLAPSNARILLAVDAIAIFAGCLTVCFRRHVLVARIWIAAMSVVCTLFAVELYMRSQALSDYEQESELQRIRTPHPKLHHALKPNTEAYVFWGNRKIKYFTNDLGYRDREIRKVSPQREGDLRVLVLGDSFAECIGVEYEHSFVAQLERLFRGRGVTAEILTAGVISYSPKLYYRRLVEFLDEGYEVDHVLVLLDISDLDDEGHLRGEWDAFSAEELASLEVERAARLEQAREADEALKRYRMVRPLMLDLVLGRLKKGKEPGLFTHSETARFRWTEVDHMPSWYEAGLASCEAYLKKIADLCASNGLPMYLVIYPHPTQLVSQRHPSRYQEIFSRFAEEEGIKLIDLFPVFLHADDWRHYFILKDIHWNRAGHALVANQIYKQAFPMAK